MSSNATRVVKIGAILDRMLQLSGSRLRFPAAVLLLVAELLLSPLGAASTELAGSEGGEQLDKPPPVVDISSLNQRDNAIAAAFERLDPSVVEILTKKVSIKRENQELIVENDVGLGSGVVVSQKGHIVTAAHVLDGARAIRVRLRDGTISRASVLFSDDLTDIALLKTVEKPREIRPAILGDSDQVRVGQTALVIGVPLGAEHSLAIGHISARRMPEMSVGAGITLEVLQTDAAVNPGNSGGPLFNLEGEVVGIVNHLLSNSGGSQGLGFAVASNTVRKLLAAARVPWIGINAVYLPPELVRALNLPGSSGALLVQTVMEGGPADQAGIQGGYIPGLVGGQTLLLGGDVITRVNQQQGCHYVCMVDELRESASSRQISIVVWRDGEEHEIVVDLESL